MALTVRVIAVTPTTEVPVKAVGIAENLSVTIETVFNKFVSVMFKTRTVLRMSQVKLKDVYWASWSFTIYWWTHLTDCILKERSTEAQLNCFLCQMLLLQNITEKRFYFLESDFPSHEWHLGEFADTAFLGAATNTVFKYVYKHLKAFCLLLLNTLATIKLWRTSYKGWHF